MMPGIMLPVLAGCGKYVSGYKAVGFVHSSSRTSAWMDFYSFDGTMVFRMVSPGEGDLKYSAMLESGAATVYYDDGGTKSELFSISSGETLESSGGYLEKGTVYVIVQTDGPCMIGEFRFRVE